MYPFMVGQRFVDMHAIKECRQRYFALKQIHLCILPVTTQKIMVECYASPACTFFFNLEYENDILAWVIQEPYSITNRSGHVWTIATCPEPVAVPNTPPPPIQEVLNLVSPEEVAQNQKKR